MNVGTKHQFEAVHRNRAGDLLYIDSTAAPIRGEDGSTVGYVVVNRDMTARKRYEQELEELNASLEERVRDRTAELERSNRELDQFAYVASHDLKAPLRAIALLAEWITEDAAPLLPPASLAHLAKLNGRVRRLDKLLSDLLDYSRCRAHQQRPRAGRYAAAGSEHRRAAQPAARLHRRSGGVAAQAFYRTRPAGNSLSQPDPERL